MHKNVNINLTRTLAYNVDGQQLLINNDNGEVAINFFQIFPGVDNNGQLNGQTIACIRMNKDQARQMSEDIIKAIDEYEKNLKSIKK